MRSVLVRKKKFKPSANQNEYPSFLSSALALHGSVTPKVLMQVFWTALYACIISLINIHSPYLSIAVGPFEYAGIVMGLILVFRINAGYERWWEARKIWGDIVNKSRNLGLMLVSYASAYDKQEMKQHIRYLAAIPYTIKKSLRHTTDYSDVAYLLDKKTLSQLPKAQNPTMILSQKIALYLKQLRNEDKLDPFSFIQIDSQREKTIDSLGACERILNTPMPFVMAIKSRRLILLFLLILPFALVSISNVLAPFITALVAYAFFSLDQIGVELQNPFWESNLSHHPLTTICNRIENDIFSLLPDKD